jgi:hypothetical protein
MPTDPNRLSYRIGSGYQRAFTWTKEVFMRRRAVVKSQSTGVEMVYYG